MSYHISPSAGFPGADAEAAVFPVILSIADWTFFSSGKLARLIDIPLALILKESVVFDATLVPKDFEEDLVAVKPKDDEKEEINKEEKE